MAAMLLSVGVLLHLVAVAVGSEAELDESHMGFFLRHHTFEWIKSRPELPKPDELEGICERPVAMHLEQAEVTDPLTGEKVYTRAWNGQIPGPTWRVKPGCKIELTVYNALKDPSWNVSVASDQANLPPIINGSYAYLNTTNVHTHGLHVSPTDPADDIFMRLDPQKWLNWVIDIPANHMGGTHWYHPHLHHATASQAGGGAAGMIIVEDPVGSLPDYVEKMEEKILVFLVLDFQLQASIEKQGMGTYFWQTKSKTNALVVNGVSQPKITLQQGKWYRFRMLFSSIEMLLQMTNKGDAWCTTKLLAKDGVWLNVAPRDLTGGWTRKPIPIQLGPGNRADIAIACTCPFPKRGCYSEFYSLQNCTDEALGVDASDDAVEAYNEGNNTPPNYTPCNPYLNCRRRACEGKPETPDVLTWGPLDPPRCGFGKAPLNVGKVQHGPGIGSMEQDHYFGLHREGLDHSLLDVFNGTIFSVIVEPTWKAREFWHPAWKFSVRRPCYLVDMRKAVVEEANMRHIEFWGAGYAEQTFTNKPGPIAVMWDGLKPNLPPAQWPSVGEEKFVDPPTPVPYGEDIPLGAAVSWWVGGVAFHPFHLHVSPFQIQNLSGTQNDWIMDGDWQDVMISPQSNCNNSGLPCPLTTQQIEPPGAPFPGYAGVTTVRFWTDNFPGKYISHCHLLTHEDEGMMFYVNVTGTPGTVPQQAMELDPTCYNSHLEGWGFRWRRPSEGRTNGALLEETQRKRHLRSVRRHGDGDVDESAYLQMSDELWDEEDEEEHGDDGSDEL